jgi:hypothetical protein
MKRALLLCTALCALALLASCKDADTPPDEIGGNMIPYAASYQGFTFYPDGYGKLTYVTYYPISFNDGNGDQAWATNSDGKNYGNLTWTFTPPESSKTSSTATLRFVYQNGDYEVYTLHNDAPPSGYRGNHYYEYEGHSGGSTVTYDGSWDLDADLNNTHGLIVLWLKSSASGYSVDLYVNGVKKSTLYANQCCVLKVPYGTYDVREECSNGTDVSEQSAFKIGYNKWYYHYWY